MSASTLMVSRTPFVDAVAVGGADPTGATDSTAAINACIAQYGAVSLPPGTFKITGSGINLGQDVHLYGAGPGLTVLMHAAATGNVVTITGGQNGFLEGVALDRAVPAIAGGNGIGEPATGAPPPTNNYIFRDIVAQNQWFGVAGAGAYYGTFDNVQCNECYSDGWNFDGEIPLQSVLTNCGAQLNNGWGFQILATGSGYCPVGQMSVITTFANGLGGINFQGSPQNSIDDVRLMNYNGSGNGGTDLNFMTYGEHNEVIGGLIEGAGCGSSVNGVGMCGRGLGMKASGIGYGALATASNGELSIIGMQVRGCANSGIATRGAFSTLLIAHNQVSQNNVSGGGDGAIFLTGTVSRGASIIGNMSESGGLQKYGLYNGLTGPVVAVGNALTGSIANYGGAPMVGVNV